MEEKNGRFSVCAVRCTLHDIFGDGNVGTKFVRKKAPTFMRMLNMGPLSGH